MLLLVNIGLTTATNASCSICKRAACWPISDQAAQLNVITAAGLLPNQHTRGRRAAYDSIESHGVQRNTGSGETCELHDPGYRRQITRHAEKYPLDRIAKKLPSNITKRRCSVHFRPISPTWRTPQADVMAGPVWGSVFSQQRVCSELLSSQLCLRSLE
jgi:hypothetical protein